MKLQKRIRSLLSLVPALAVSACFLTDRGVPAAFRGVALAAPVTKPSFTLTDFDGQSYDFMRETNDKVALLFFGYTHCPDVCPLHMANIAAVLRSMPSEERMRIVTVFVTTDPERDTPERLKSWLANFDPTFIGLTGTPAELVAVQALLGLRQAQREYLGADTVNYFVSHAAQVFAFARDGNGYLIYPFGIRQEDWAADLPRLARDASGAEIRRALAAANAQQTSFSPQASSVTMGGLYVTQAVVAQPAAQTEAALYLSIRNDTPQEDTLIAVAADLAVRAEIHETMGTGEMRRMMSVSALPLPPRMETRLLPGGTHVMLLDLRKPLRPGDTVTLYLSLARAGPVEAMATVVSYADLDRTLSAPAEPVRK